VPQIAAYVLLPSAWSGSLVTGILRAAAAAAASYRTAFPQMLMAVQWHHIVLAASRPFRSGSLVTGIPHAAAAAPCRTVLPQMLMAGFLPFSAIYVELYYIFASVWGHKVYIIWSILLIVYIILIIVTAFITVALTYFQVGGLLKF
jgi:hypothetical protein